MSSGSSCAACRTTQGQPELHRENLLQKKIKNNHKKSKHVPEFKLSASVYICMFLFFNYVLI